MRTDPAADIRAAGVRRADPVGLAVAEGVGLALALPGRPAAAYDVDPQVLRRIDDEVRPRWVWWSPETAAVLVRAGVRVATCWDVAAVHRLLVGGWRADPARAWAAVHDLDADTIPASRQPDLFDPGPDPGELEEPVGLNGHLRPEWVAGAWAATPARLARWAELAVSVADRQRALLDDAVGAGAGDRSVGVDRRAALRRAVRRRPSDRSSRSRADHRGDRRPADADLGRGRRPACGARRRGVAPRTAGWCRRPAPPRSGALAAAARRARGAGHPGLAARGPPRRASARRRPVDLAQGRACRDDVRLRLARRARRQRRAAARTVDRLRRRGGPHDGDRRAAQHAGRPAPGCRRRGRARVRAGRPRTDRAAGPGRRVRRRPPRPGDPRRRHVRPGRRTARRRPGDGEGRRPRGHVRADDGPRRARPAPPGGDLPGGDGLPPRRRRRGPGRP